MSSLLILQVWKKNRKDIKTVKKVFTEFSLLDVGFQILIGGCNHSYIDLDSFCAADPHQLLLLEDPQKFHLDRKGGWSRSHLRRWFLYGPLQIILSLTERLQ